MPLASRSSHISIVCRAKYNIPIKPSMTNVSRIQECPRWLHRVTDPGTFASQSTTHRHTIGLYDKPPNERGDSKGGSDWVSTYVISFSGNPCNEECAGTPSTRWKALRFLCIVIWNSEEPPSLFKISNQTCPQGFRWGSLRGCVPSDNDRPRKEEQPDAVQPTLSG